MLRSRRRLGACFLGFCYAVGVPLLLHVHRVPDVLGKVGGTLVDVYEFDELRVQVGIAKRAIRHEGVIEVSRIMRVSFEHEEVRDLCLCVSVLVSLGDENEWARRAEAGRTLIASSHGSLGSGGMPQSWTPGMGGGRSSCRILVNSSGVSLAVVEGSTASCS